MKRFSFYKSAIFAYIKSMRVYLFFLSGMAGCLGIVFSETTPPFAKTFSILCVVFIGWGVNQVINDLLGLKEDRINAPNRPLVKGVLSIRMAISISIFLFVLGGIVTYTLNSQALILYWAVFILNVIYEYSKKIPWLGNFVFGLLLVPCVYYGAMCVNGKGLEIFKNQKLFCLSLAVILINFAVAFFTYYKDFRGDKAVGKNTIIVKLTPNIAKYLNCLMSLLPFTVLIFFLFSPIWKDSINLYFLGFMFLSFVIMQYTAYLFFRNPQGKNTYYSLKWNFRGAVLYKTSFIALFNPLLAGILYIMNFVIVGFLFNLHKDYLA